MNKAKALREGLQGGGILRVAGGHNPLGAKLAASAGFDAIWASGLEISAAQALPDANILTMTEFLRAAAAMNDAVPVPVIADCDTGFGNSTNVIHMVHKYERAGVAAVCIEDKRFPKTNSLVSGRQELATVAEFVGKIMAAKNAQASPEFLVIARVEALIAGRGRDEALRRARAYADAGADAVVIHSRAPGPEEVLAFAEAWQDRLPLAVIPTTYPSVSAQALEQAGIRMVIYANQGIRATIRAMRETYAEIYARGSSAPVEDRIATLDEVFEIQDLTGLQDSERLYLRAGRSEFTAVIPAAGDHLEEYSMTAIASDIPVACLDINGKTLLERQRETLNRAGISRICVIAGYKKEAIRLKGVDLVENPDYGSTGILHSLMCARRCLQGRVFLTYGDILFDDDTLESLLRAREDILLLVDPGFRDRNVPEGKALDLVTAERPPERPARRLGDPPNGRVRRIGPRVDPADAHYEFPGLMTLSAKGCEILREVYDGAAAQYGGRPFHGADRFERAGLVDLLQEVVNAGYEVACMERSSGWLEIHSFDDYRLACAMTGRGMP